MKLFDKFDKYTPATELTKYSEAEILGMRVDKELRMLEVDISSSIIIPKRDLYRIEAEIKEAYNLNYFRIHPKYNIELYSIDYLDDIILETYRQGAVARGFFDDYSFSKENDTIVIKVPFIDGGIMLLDGAETTKVLSKIVYDEFGAIAKFKIAQREDYKLNIENFENEKLNILRRALEQQKKDAPKTSEKKAQEAENEMRTKSRLYSALGLFGGIFAALILV